MERNPLRVKLFDKTICNSTLVDSDWQQIKKIGTNQRSCCSRKTTKVSSKKQQILVLHLFVFIKKHKQVCSKLPIMSTSLLLSLLLLITTYLSIAHSNKHLLTAQAISHNTGKSSSRASPLFEVCLDR